MKAVDPEWNPKVWADRRAAWEGAYPEAPDIPIRIEAAAYLGRPVSFGIVHPWTAAAGGPPVSTSLLIRISSALFFALVMLILIGAVLLARRNVRLGRGDRKGARRLASAVFLLGCCGVVLTAHHVAAAREIGRVVRLTGLPLLLASILWIFYLAVEPDVRRLWTQMIVSWVRLLDGRFRDPLIGRDIVIGGACGIVLRLIDQLYPLASEWLGLASRIGDLNSGPPPDQILASMSGMRLAFGNLATYCVVSLLFPLAGVVLLVLCRVITRGQWLGIGLFVILLNITSIASDVDPRTYILWGLLTTTVNLIILFRFGLLANIVATACAALIELVFRANAARARRDRGDRGLRVQDLLRRRPDGAAGNGLGARPPSSRGVPVEYDVAPCRASRPG